MSFIMQLPTTGMFYSCSIIRQHHNAYTSNERCRIRLQIANAGVQHSSIAYCYVNARHSKREYILCGLRTFDARSVSIELVNKQNCQALYLYEALTPLVKWKSKRYFMRTDRSRTCIALQESVSFSFRFQTLYNEGYPLDIYTDFWDEWRLWRAFAKAGANAPVHPISRTRNTHA